jgi:hypothetical protein
MKIEIDLSQFPSGTKHKTKKPIDRAAIRRKHRDSYWAARTVLTKIRRERTAKGFLPIRVTIAAASGRR